MHRFPTRTRRPLTLAGLGTALALLVIAASADEAAAMSLNRGSFQGPATGRVMMVSPRPTFGRPGMGRVPGAVTYPGSRTGRIGARDRHPGSRKPHPAHRPPVIVRGPAHLPPAVTVITPPPPPTGPAAAARGPGRQPAISLPPGNDRNYVADEVLVSFTTSLSRLAVDTLARRQRLAVLDTHRLPLIDTTLYRFRITNGRSVRNAISTLARDSRVSAVQPNYLYDTLENSAAAAAGDPAQYVLGKLNVPQAHALATGSHVRVAIIDSSIDARHPDLEGSIMARFDAVGTAEKAHQHGTAIASAVAAHGHLLGIAPAASLLAARAFDSAAGATRGTTVRVLDSLQWAADNGARIVNMSFAGPPDARLADMLAAAHRRGIVLIAAAGNNGPVAPPAYPAAYPDVLAVTATDAADHLFAQANHGAYLAVAAPGVDILVATPGGSYQLTTGTSVAAAHVTGLAALLLQRAPNLTPDQVAAALTRSAHDLGSPGRDAEFGAGLVDALDALNALAPQTAESATH
jgi:subtilisin family serine protease